ncbi:xylose repressor protein [Pullulanibacillus camelliae]|uniref:Xylose repressor protein n=1 Tax=Pullulanibacillus camelliae TaxID=1707096 RepID=A0A8J2YGC3_9BACL|nr:ROK family transcriptional regulator [Pullulanibacillus camelliae]GGE38117.1 xylose repressor protein [Pullulanibacillus camelliae]
MRRTGDLKLIQELNQFIVLDAIRESGPISRSAIAKKHNLSLTTVTSLVKNLMEEGYVTEAGIGESSGGRKPRLIKFCPDSRYLIGVSLRNSRITIAEMNLNAVVKQQKIIPVIQQEQVIATILEQIERFLEEIQNDKENCIGISFITQGIVNTAKGMIHYNPKLKLIDVPLKKYLEERFKLPVWLDNDTNAHILAEKHLGIRPVHDHAIYITIGDGVGAGIVVNGQMYRGASGGAGEFGHTTIDRGGIPCDCGNVGCLENYVSWPALYSRILTFIKKGRQTLIYSLANEDIRSISPRILVEAVNLKDPFAVELMNETASYLSAGIVNLLHLFNPNTLILGGEVTNHNPYLLEKIEENVKRQALKILVEDLEIRQTTFGDHLEMTGAAAVLLQDFFEFSLIAK